MKREHQETTEECKARADDFLSKLRMTTAIIVICQTHLEIQAKILEDEYPEVNTEIELKVVFDQLNSIGNKLTKYAEEVMEVR